MIKNGAEFLIGPNWRVKGNYGSQGRQEGRLLIGFTEPGVGPVDEDSVSGTERTVCMAA